MRKKNGEEEADMRKQIRGSAERRKQRGCGKEEV